MVNCPLLLMTMIGIVTTILSAGCGSGSQSPDGDTLIDGDADQPDQSDAPDATDDPEGDFEIALPRLTDWECPPGWRTAPAFVDTQGNERIPEGLRQHAICQPPSGWAGSSGPAVLESWSCPSGWVATPLEPYTDWSGRPFKYCRPSLPTNPCPAGMMATPGDAACRWVGEACPEGEWPDNLPQGYAVLHVRPGAVGGDGSPERPYGTIAAAMADPKAPRLVALARGTYREAITIRPDDIVWGACAAGTIIEAPGPLDNGATVTMEGQLYGENGIRNVTITGDRRGIRLVDQAGIARIQGVIIDRSLGHGLIGENGGRAALDDVLITGTRPLADGSAGRCLEASGRLNLTINRSAFVGCREAAVAISGAGTTLAISGSSIIGTDSRPDGLFGRGIQAQDGAQLELVRSFLGGNRDVGIAIDGAGATATIADTIVEATQGDAKSGAGGRGLNIDQGAVVTAERLLLEGNRSHGIWASATGTRLILSDTLVVGTLEQSSNGRHGRGIEIQTGARLEAERLVLDGNREVGLFINNPGATVSLADSIVASTRRQAVTDDFGRGIDVSRGGRVEAARLLITDNADIGLMLNGGGSSGSIEGVSIRGSGEPGAGGNGIRLQDVSQLDARLIEIADCRGVGLIALGAGAEATIYDASIAGTGSDAKSLAGGRGVEANGGASIVGRRMVIRRNREGGVLAGNEATGIELDEVIIYGTVPAACALLPENDPRFCLPPGMTGVGIGAGAYDGGLLSMSRFLVLENATVGLQISTSASSTDTGGRMHLTDGVVANHDIGVNIQVPGYDTASLQQRVWFINRRNLAYDDLPIPDPSEALSDLAAER